MSGIHILHCELLRKFQAEVQNAKKKKWEWEPLKRKSSKQFITNKR